MQSEAVRTRNECHIMGMEKERWAKRWEVFSPSVEKAVFLPGVIQRCIIHTGNAAPQATEG